MSISVFGMPFSNRLIALSKSLKRFIYVCADLNIAKKAYEMLKSLNVKAILLNELDDCMCYVTQSIENNLNRLKAINEIALNDNINVIVTTTLAFMQLYPNKNQILNHSINLESNLNIDPQILIELLVSSGYKRTTQIDEIGQFALRGGILDISPINYPYAIRLDFFDQTLEKIRKMDISTQKGGEEINFALIAPACEVFLPYKTNEIDILKQKLLKYANKFQNEQANSIISKILGIIETQTTDRFLNFIKPLLNQCKLEELFNAKIIFDEAKRCVDNFNIHLTEHKNRFESLLMQGMGFEFLLNQLRDNLSTDIDVQQVTFDRFLCQNRIFNPQEVLNYNDEDTVEYPKNKKFLLDDVEKYLKDNFKVIVPDIEPSRQLFCNIKHKNLIFLNETLLGAKFNFERIVYIGVTDIINKKLTTSTQATTKNTFFQPKINDYVVHPKHGIGICEGIERMNMSNAERDYIIIRYEQGKLYVSCENLNLISAYLGEENPKLNKIGGLEFTKAKERAKKALQQMAFDLSKLYASRQAQKGHLYNPNHYDLSEFEAEFPYEETPCQKTAIEECILDLTRGKVMDRLLCGDVGYGKTEVAMRVAFKVVLEGKQVAFISPTTVLSKQHFSTLTRRMSGFGVKIGSLSRFDTPQQIKNTLDGLKNGSIDIVCGTHRVLSKDVIFKDLGLLILDEEQRFGVADKEKIKLLKNDVNVLSLSATPIPRTLHMAMSGIRDISVLDTPPRGRIEVSTYVCAYSDSLVFDAINREINRKGQAFIVYNRVEYIETYATQISKIFPNLKIRIAHGQMEKTRLENALTDFVLGNADILIASTIIENGIDMANVNTMIVVDSDKLGLGQMYQLRGRIGRGNRQAYAYFTYESNKILTENALKRLEAITSYTRFGSGFKLAMADLEIRGAGDVLGAQQHGHIQKIGYDMYLRLIGEVMNELNGEVSTQPDEVKINIDFDAFIPHDYITSIEWRLKTYSQISLLNSKKQGEQEVLRLKDVYGDVPLSVKNLIFISIIKNRCANLNAISVTLTKNLCQIKFKPNLKIDETFLKNALKNGFNYNATLNTLSIKPVQSTNILLLSILHQD